MALEIHFDQLENAVGSFTTGKTAFIDTAGIVTSHITHEKDTLMSAHQNALSVLQGLLESGTGNFTQASAATQSVIDRFKEADQSGGLH